MREVERHAEEEAAPGERRDDGVDPDRRGRDRERQEDGDERRRRPDHQLERPLPALPLDRAAGAEQRRRPDPHQPRAEGDVEERPAWFPDSTMKKAIEAKITGWSTETSTKKSEVRERLQVEEPADREQARAHAQTVTSGQLAATSHPRAGARVDAARAIRLLRLTLVEEGRTVAGRDARRADPRAGGPRGAAIRRSTSARPGRRRAARRPGAPAPDRDAEG